MQLSPCQALGGGEHGRAAQDQALQKLMAAYESDEAFAFL